MANFKCGANRGLSVNTEASWDGAAAKSSIFKWAGFDGDSPDSAKARQGFLVYDAAAPKLKGSYKLPFARYEGGTLEAVKAGVDNAASRLPQTQGLSDGVKAEAQAVIDHYQSKAGEGDDKKDNGTGERAVFAHPARVTGLTNTDELLTLARKAAPDPSVFDEAAPYFFRAEISSNRLDSYYTRMDAGTTLTNFKTDADAGVAFMNSHRTGGSLRNAEMPFGRTLAGHYTGAGGNGVARVEADLYTLPGLRMNEVNTDDLIRGIRSGIASDVSVGFLPGAFRCDICGRDMLTDYDCQHIPGFKYSPPPEKNRKKSASDAGKVVCTATVMDGRLVEVSSVYDGATPGAAILKAQRMAEAGQLLPEAARALEQVYHVRFPGVRHFYSLGRQAGARERCLPANKEERMADELEDQFREVLEGSPITWGGDPVEAMRGAVAEINRTRPIVAEYARIQGILTERGFDAGTAVKEKRLPDLVAEVAREAVDSRALAADGRKYREACVEEALASGVRAFGDTFKREMYEGMLKSAPLESVRQMKTDWDGIGDRLFPGGRKTSDQGEEKPGNGKQPDAGLPAAAVKTGRGRF